MGFRLSSFLGGMAEGAIEIEENVRKRNEKLIDTSLTLSAERTSKALDDRKKTQEVYDMLAKELRSYDLDDDKVNVVLAYGPEKAKQFLTDAPTKAKREGLSVADYVVLMETNEGKIPSISTERAIQANLFPGLYEIKDSERPELRESPILGRDYGAQYESTKDSLYKGMGIEIPEQVEGAELREGKINFMDLLTGEGGTEGLGITRSGINKSVAEYLVPLSNTNINITKEGDLVYDEEQQAVASAIANLQTRVALQYNELIQTAPAQAKANPEKFYQLALNNVLQEVPESYVALFPGLKLGEASGDARQEDGSAPAAPAPTGDVGSQISAIDSDATLTDAQKKVRKRAVVRSAGLAKTIQEADQIIASGNY